VICPLRQVSGLRRTRVGAVEGYQGEGVFEVNSCFEELEGVDRGVGEPQVRGADSYFGWEAGDEDAAAGAGAYDDEAAVAQDPPGLVHDRGTDR
jgi:hypothetical protein